MPGYRRGIRLPGAVVVVAGVTGAVGSATAAALAARGARPVLLDTDTDTDTATATATGGAALARAAERCAGVVPLPVDLGDPEAVHDAARRAARRYGRIDGWVQCTGAEARGGPGDIPLLDGSVTDGSEQAVRRVLDRDVLGSVHAVRAAVPHLAAADGGVLVLVASVHGQIARPGAAPQAMAAAAVRVLAATLHQELRRAGTPGVAVTTVLAPDVTPGSFPAGRPERVAATVLRRLRRPALETVGGGPVATALVHGHALVPAVTEWLVARRAGRGAPGRGPGG